MGSTRYGQGSSQIEECEHFRGILGNWKVKKTKMYEFFSRDLLIAEASPRAEIRHIKKRHLMIPKSSVHVNPCVALSTKSSKFPFSMATSLMSERQTPIV